MTMVNYHEETNTDDSSHRGFPVQESGSHRALGFRGLNSGESNAKKSPHEVEAGFLSGFIDCSMYQGLLPGSPIPTCGLGSCNLAFRYLIYYPHSHSQESAGK